LLDYVQKDQSANKASWINSEFPSPKLHFKFGNNLLSSLDVYGQGPFFSLLRGPLLLVCAGSEIVLSWLGNATKNFALVTRISQLVASGQLTTLFHA